LTIKESKSLIAVDYICRKAYQKKMHINLKPTKTKVECITMMGLKKAGLRWTKSKLVVKYNHELLCPKSIGLIDTLNESGVPLWKIMSVLSKQSGGDYNIGCIAKYVESYLGNRRRA
jgi:hypothetical protein